MTRFDYLRPAAMLAYHSTAFSGAFSMLMWILYGEGWLGADQFRAGLLIALFLLAGGLLAAVPVAVAGLLLRDKDRS